MVISINWLSYNPRPLPSLGTWGCKYSLEDLQEDFVECTFLSKHLQNLEGTYVIKCVSNVSNHGKELEPRQQAHKPAKFPGSSRESKMKVPGLNFHDRIFFLFVWFIFNSRVISKLPSSYPFSFVFLIARDNLNFVCPPMSYKKVSAS